MDLVGVEVLLVLL